MKIPKRLAKKFKAWWDRHEFDRNVSDSMLYAYRLAKRETRELVRYALDHPPCVTCECNDADAKPVPCSYGQDVICDLRIEWEQAADSYKWKVKK